MTHRIEGREAVPVPLMAKDPDFTLSSGLVTHERWWVMWDSPLPAPRAVGLGSGPNAVWFPCLQQTGQSSGAHEWTFAQPGGRAAGIGAGRRCAPDAPATGRPGLRDHHLASSHPERPFSCALMSHLSENFSGSRQLGLDSLCVSHTELWAPPFMSIHPPFLGVNFSPLRSQRRNHRSGPSRTKEPTQRWSWVVQVARPFRRWLSGPTVSPVAPETPGPSPSTRWEQGVSWLLIERRPIE